MKMSKFNRFVRVNLIGLLAVGNLLVVFFKFKVERPQTITYRCDGKHVSTNAAPVSAVVTSFAAVSPGQPVKQVSSVPQSLRGDWSEELKEVSCDYIAGVADGVPILQTGAGRYYRRGDLTRWGRVTWIGADFFTTDKCLVRLEPVQEVAAIQGGEK